MLQITQQEFKKKLNEGIVDFKFTKIDGTERIVSGTTNLNLIPEEFHPIGTKRALNQDVVRFFDTALDEFKDPVGWRSAYFDSITEVN